MLVLLKLGFSLYVLSAFAGFGLGLGWRLSRLVFREQANEKKK